MSEVSGGFLKSVKQGGYTWEQPQKIVRSPEQSVEAGAGCGG